MGDEFWIGIWCGLGFSMIALVTISLILGH
jgi:hypothetical protein